MTTRAPVMAPAPAGRRGLAVVRRRRLRVDDGALVLLTEHGHREVLAPAGGVVSATWVPDVLDRPEARLRETVEIGLRDGGVLAFPLDDWLAADDRVVPRQKGGRLLTPLDASGSTALRVTGAAALIAALGVPVTSAATLTPGARVVGASAQLPAVVVVLRRTWAVLAVFVLGLTGAGLAFAVPGIEVLLAGVLATSVAVAVSLAVSLREDMRAQSALQDAQLPAPPWRPSPVAPCSRDHVRRALLSSGPDWLVVRDEHGRECWTPGPQQGGVVAARVRGSWLALEDDTGAALHRLWWPSWGDERALAGVLDDLRVRGYRVAHEPDEPEGPMWRPGPRPGAGLSRRRDAGAGTPFPAASAAPFALLLVGEPVLDGRLPALAALPALVATGLAVVVGVRGVSARRGAAPSSSGPGSVTP